MMKQMGIQQVDIPATEVIIRTEDKEIVITSPSVAKVNMMGQESLQITGKLEEYEEEKITEEDIETVMEKADASKAEAKKALEDNDGDIAAAILSLKEA